MSSTRAALVGAGIGGGSGVLVGGAIAQFLAGPGTDGLLWLAALIGSIDSGIVSALVTRSSIRDSHGSASIGR